MASGLLFALIVFFALGLFHSEPAYEGKLSARIASWRAAIPKA
jgi:hypothetical protein